MRSSKDENMLLLLAKVVERGALHPPSQPFVALVPASSQDCMTRRLMLVRHG